VVSSAIMVSGQYRRGREVTIANWCAISQDVGTAKPSMHKK
jgi:hypothetical protein